MEINTENLSIGQIVPNYKIMCGLLSDSVKDGKSKIYQTEDWQRYFRFSKVGIKYIIEESLKPTEGH